MTFAAMRAAKFAVPFAALIVAACGGGPRPVADLGPPPALHREPTWQKPQPPPAHSVAPPHGPVGPLTVARIGSYMDALETELRRHVRGAGIVVVRQGDNINLIVPNTLLFSSDGGVNGDDVLEPLAAVLRAYGHTSVSVNGFTDTTGSPEHNLDVSQKRARLIADALAHEGVSAGRVSSQGFGKTHLRIATGDDKNEPRNRRIEFLLRARPG